MPPTREESPARRAFRALGGVFPNPPADELETLAPCARCHSTPRRSESMRTAEDSTRGARLPRSRPRAPSSKPLRSETPCGVSRRLRSIADAPPPGMNAHTRPVLAVGPPQIEERIDTRELKGIAPRRPAEIQLPLAIPGPPPATLDRGRSCSFAQPLIRSDAPERQQCQPEERQDLHDRLHPLAGSIRLRPPASSGRTPARCPLPLGQCPEGTRAVARSMVGPCHAPSQGDGAAT